MDPYERFENADMEKHYSEIPKFRKLLGYDKFIERVKQRDDIISLVCKLHWDMSEDVQNCAIETIKETVSEDDYDLLILSGYIFTWPNVVKILKEAGYPKNIKALPSLILLLQDINWPGAVEGMSVMRGADRKVLVPMLEIAIEEAHSTNDEDWMSCIKRFLDFAEIDKSDFGNKEMYSLVEHVEW